MEFFKLVAAFTLGVILCGTADAQTPSVGRIGVTPTTIPEGVSIMDKNGAWVSVGSITPGVNGWSSILGYVDAPSGTQTSNYIPFSLTLNDHGAFGNNYAFSFMVNDILADPTITGSRNGADFQMLFEVPNLNTFANGWDFYTPLSTNAAIGSPPNNIAGPSNYQGFMYGGTAQCVMQNNGQYWGACDGFWVGTSLAYTSTAITGGSYTATAATINFASGVFTHGITAGTQVTLTGATPACLNGTWIAGTQTTTSINVSGLSCSGSGSVSSAGTVISSASAKQRVGLSSESDGYAHGGKTDAAFQVWGGSVGGLGYTTWNTGFVIDDIGGSFPISAGGTVLRSGNDGTTPPALYAGIDLSRMVTPWATDVWGGASLGDAIILPNGNGGISFGIGGVAGRVVSVSNTSGALMQFGGNDLQFKYAGTTAFEISSTGSTSWHPFSVIGATIVYGTPTIGPELFGRTTDYSAGISGSGFFLQTNTTTGNAGSILEAFQNGSASSLASLTLASSSVIPVNDNATVLGTSSFKWANVNAGSYSVGAVNGISCAAGTVNLTTFTVTNGIVTHC